MTKARVLPLPVGANSTASDPDVIGPYARSWTGSRARPGPSPSSPPASLLPSPSRRRSGIALRTEDSPPASPFPAMPLRSSPPSAPSAAPSSAPSSAAPSSSAAAF